MPVTLEQYGIERLSTEDRLALIDLIWDSLPQDATFTPPPWHLRELERRLADADANPEAEASWDEVYARLTTSP